MTKRECAIIMTYTGTCMLTGDDLKYFYEYIAELIGRPVYTLEIPALADDLEEKAKPDFIKLCKEATNYLDKSEVTSRRMVLGEDINISIGLTEISEGRSYSDNTPCITIEHGVGIRIFSDKGDIDIHIGMTEEQAKAILKGIKMQIKRLHGIVGKCAAADSTELHKVSSRPKSEQYVCISCGEFCYYPHSKHEIPYRFCPNCGRVVRGYA